MSRRGRWMTGEFAWACGPHAVSLRGTRVAGNLRWRGTCRRSVPSRRVLPPAWLRPSMNALRFSRRPVLCWRSYNIYAVPTGMDRSPATCRDRRGCATKRYRVISSASEGKVIITKLIHAAGSGSSDARSSKCTEGGTGNRLSRASRSLCAGRRNRTSDERRRHRNRHPRRGPRRPSASSRARSILWIHRPPTSISR